MPNKVCNKCKEEKPTEEFYFNSRYGKPIARCKECIAAYSKTPEARAVRNTPERREKRRQYGAEYRARPEVILAKRLSAREYNQRPEVIARRQTPEAKARKAAYDQSPENRARARIRDRQPARRKQQDELRRQSRREDPVLNLRFLVSSMVNKGMRKQNVTKNNSTWNALPPILPYNCESIWNRSLTLGWIGIIMDVKKVAGLSIILFPRVVLSLTQWIILTFKSVGH